MKYFEKTYNDELDISIESFSNEITETDKLVFERIENDKEVLFGRAKNYVEEIIDVSKPLFQGGLKLYSIYIKGVSERSYQIEMHCYYENDDHMIWSVTFNLPLQNTDAESLAKAKLWPIEFKRRVE